MRSSPITILLAMMSVTAATVAQDTCAMTRASEVPASGVLGPVLPCASGFKLDFNGVRVGSNANTCPSWVTLTPTHHEAIACSDRTYAEIYGMVQEQIINFNCTRHTFLGLFSLDSTCDRQPSVNSGSFPLMVTRRCPNETIDQ